MFVRLGQFYAFVLLLICLMVNIAVFPEVREPFLGNVDPTASVKSAFSELDIQERISEIYSSAQSNGDDIQSVVPQKVEPAKNLQPPVVAPVPKPAATRQVFAEQFKPVVPEQKPAISVK